MDFYTIATVSFLNAIANAILNGGQILITHLAVGDANGVYYEPLESQTQLVHETWRGEVDSVGLDPEDASRILVTATITEDIGGWGIMEVGLYSGATLMSVTKYPVTYKPAPEEGATKALEIRIQLDVSNPQIIDN